MLRTINSLATLLFFGVTAPLHGLEARELKMYAEQVHPGEHAHYFADRSDYEARYYQMDILAGWATEGQSKSLKPLHNAILEMWTEYVIAGKKTFSSLDEVKALLNNEAVHIRKRSMLLDIMYFETKDRHFMAEAIAQNPYRVKVFISVKDRDFTSVLSIVLARALEERGSEGKNEQDLRYGAAIRTEFIELVGACLFQNISEDLLHELLRCYPLVPHLHPYDPSDKMVFDAIKGHGDKIFSKFLRALMSTEEGRALLSSAIKEGIIDKDQVKYIKFAYDSETTKAIFGNE
jgi:hypothetical protein